MILCIKYICPSCKNAIVKDKMFEGDIIKVGDEITGATCGDCYSDGLSNEEAEQATVLAVWKEGKREPHLTMENLHSKIKEKVVFT